MPGLVYFLPHLAVIGLIGFLLVRLMRETRESIVVQKDTGETLYGYAGQELRVFMDEAGEIWILARDIRSLLGLDLGDDRMAQRYPQGYRRANPFVAAWYIRTETIRRHWQGSTREEVNRFLRWVERELVPQHRRLVQAKRVQETAKRP
jgi:hypothetical protein